MRFSSHLQALGFNIQIDGDELRISPKKGITPEIRDYIKKNKMIILEEIRKGHAEAHELSTEEKDTFPGSEIAIKVFFPALNHDVWLCADEKARKMVESEGLPCLLFTDLQFILQGKPEEDRLNRLIKVCARRHPVTEETLKLFNGKITAINPKEASL